MKQYKLANRLLGWVVFAIAAATYLLTLEPTVSFWDCGEFIASSYKLEVGHPPGAPFFMVLARIFSLFTFGEVTQVAKMVNAMSALASAFTVMFLFWTITHLGRKLLNTETLAPGQQITVLGSGLVGALAFAFSDTFWFSAVEAEVYALSSFFTAAVFWAILKWENIADEPYADRWLILIAYLMGLSIGVHLLNLLAIPAIVFVYYFRKYKPSLRGFFAALGVSVVLLAIVMYGIVQGLVRLVAQFELAFVNGMGLPFFSGLFAFLVLTGALVIYFIYRTRRKQAVLWNTILTAFLVILLGYSSFALIVIRSQANPPMDENNPEHAFALKSYLDREQYGNRPLLYGQYYSAPVDGQEDNYTYTQGQKDGKDHYFKNRQTNPTYKYDARFKTFFPRMYSGDQQHIQAYKSWGTVDGIPITVQSPRGETVQRTKPTFGDNLEFFLKYQIGHMYLRYFMWNFTGRQNDTQGHGDAMRGNWLSGVKYIDELRLGTQENLPDMLKHNEARNTYFFLPLILGLVGLFFSYNKNIKTFWVILFLFVMTGLAIVVYLNQTPYQPRERDYAYVGSFYAFAIWIGLGVMSVAELFKKFLKPEIAAGLATAILLVVPGQMAVENWDDHDRSGRYTARDFARNYLDSCEPGAILFTYGDNDTFPLWYVQEVEGYRTDVRVVNLSLLSTDWYIDQMKRKAYESEPVPFSLDSDKYLQGRRDIVPVVQSLSQQKAYKIKEIVRFVGSDSPKTKQRFSNGKIYNYFPTKKLRLPVDSARVVENGTVSLENAPHIEPSLPVRLSQNYITKSQLMILDLLAHFNWERPVYFATSIGSQYYMGLANYLRDEGFAYRLVPYKRPTPDDEEGHIDTGLLYKRLMETFTWGRMNAEDVHIDEQNNRTIRIMRIRGKFNRLAQALIDEGKNDKAVQVLDKVNKLMPHPKIPYQLDVSQTISLYYKARETEKATAMSQEVFAVMEERLAYFYTLSKNRGSKPGYEAQVAFEVLRQLAIYAEDYGQEELHKQFEPVVRKFYPLIYGDN